MSQPVVIPLLNGKVYSLKPFIDLRLTPLGKEHLTSWCGVFEDV